MKSPGRWTIRYLMKHCQENHAEINGRWVPARPLGPYGFWWRLQRAWEVFCGRVDVVEWPEGQ